jgi:hypothetical protein
MKASSGHKRDDPLPEYYRPSPELYGSLSAGDFDSEDIVYVEFEDGSSCRFLYAFWRREAEWKVVYTEHCGYHVFRDTVKILGREMKI